MDEENRAALFALRGPVEDVDRASADLDAQALRRMSRFDPESLERG